MVEAPDGHRMGALAVPRRQADVKPGAAVSMTNEFGALNVFVQGADGYMWDRAWRATGDWGAWRTAIGSR